MGRMTIRVFGIDFVVRFTERLEKDNERFRGWCDAEHCTIDIDSSLDPQIIFRTAWHETLHALLRQDGFAGLSDEVEEPLVRALAAGIVQVLQDNPQMRSGFDFKQGWK